MPDAPQGRDWYLDIKMYQCSLGRVGLAEIQASPLLSLCGSKEENTGKLTCLAGLLAMPYAPVDDYISQNISITP